MRKYSVDMSVQGSLEETFPKRRPGRPSTRREWEWEETPSAMYGRVATVDGLGHTVVPKSRRRRSGECIEIAEKVFAKLFKRRIMVPSKECIAALSEALELPTPNKHVRGAVGQIYNLRDRVGYGSIKNLNTGERFWASEATIKKLLTGQE